MIKRLAEKIRHYSLTTKIRYSYFIIMIPMLIFVGICMVGLSRGNKKYDEIVNSAVVASGFSLDFKADFDYETYLLIVGNKSIEESQLDKLLTDATKIVENLEIVTESEANKERLKNIRKYINNLTTYKERIEANLGEENKYEANIEIWENDIQIVTALLEENMSEYIYYEIKDVQAARAEYEAFYLKMVAISVSAFIIVMLITIWLSYTIPQGITKPVRELSKVTNQIAAGDLSVRADIVAGEELEAFSDSLNVMIDKINELLAQVKEEQIRLRKAELELLQSQINPHFLYNTLDTIIWLAEGGDMKKVVSMVGSLSGFFRSSLNQGRDVVSIKEEMTHVRSYLEIQQVRYQDILEYEIHIPEEIYGYSIPKITIQPLVENALYHGIKNKRGLGTIKITGELKDGNVYIQVEDDGIGMKQERLAQVNEAIKDKTVSENDVYGVFNVNERIALKFGEEYGISFKSEYEKGTNVTIKLPAE